jgi:arylsulfatase A-like enzyme
VRFSRITRRPFTCVAAIGGVGGRAIALVVSTLLGLGACSDAPSETRPSIVLVSVDTLRADAVSPWGGDVPTPTFERLAREGVVFERAYASAPETAPSHATLFTGQEVLRHGVVRNGVPLAEDASTLAEALRRAGYTTAAFVSSYVLDPRFGWRQGFGVYDATFPEADATMRKERRYPGAIWDEETFAGLDRRADATIEAALDWLSSAEPPVFLFVHLFDPHAPYVPPPAQLAALADRRFDVTGREVPGVSDAELEELIRRYHAEVTYVDAALGRLLEAVEHGSDAAPLVVVTADHGEGLGDHGHIEHSLHLYEEQLHVPLVLHWPDALPAGLRIETPVGLVDLAPTILELMGLAPLPETDGRSLAAPVRTASEPERRPVLADRRAFSAGFPPPHGPQTSVRIGDWRYIRRAGARDELYDLAHDPEERTNLVLEREQTTNAMASIVLDYRSRMSAGAAAPELSESERENLRAMGYVE